MCPFGIGTQSGTVNKRTGLMMSYPFWYTSMPYSLLISLTDLPRSLSSNIYRLNSFVYRFCFKTIFPVLLYNLSYFYPYLLSQILYQIQGDCVRVLKSFLSWDIKKRFKFLQYVYYGTDGIWSNGYFVSTVGINEWQLRKYKERQGKEDFGQTMELFE